MWLIALINIRCKHKKITVYPPHVSSYAFKHKQHCRISCEIDNTTAMNKAASFRLPGILFALSAVILGAFGAHALKDILLERGSSATWETAVHYQMWHALALILTSLIHEKTPVRPLTGYCFMIGTLLFSVSLYALALGGPRWLGPITPLGVLCLIAGWALLAYSCVTNKA